MTGLDNRPRRQPGRDRVVFCSARRTARPYSTSLLSSSLPLFLSSSLPLFLSSSSSSSPPPPLLTLSHSLTPPLSPSLFPFLSSFPIRRLSLHPARSLSDDSYNRLLSTSPTTGRSNRCPANGQASARKSAKLARRIHPRHLGRSNRCPTSGQVLARKRRKTRIDNSSDSGLRGRAKVFRAPRPGTGKTAAQRSSASRTAPRKRRYVPFDTGNIRFASSRTGFPDNFVND